MGGCVGCAANSFCRVIVNSAFIRFKSAGLVVYLGGDVRMELALPTSPCCVNFSTRSASLVSSGGRPCGVSVGVVSVSKTSQEPFQKRNSCCASVAVCQVVSVPVECRWFGRLLVCSSSWSMCMSSFHKRDV